MKKQAIVLCSGGLDSVTAAHLIRKKYSPRKMTLLFFNYGQISLHQEIICSKACAQELKAEFVEIRLPELRTISPLSEEKKKSSLKSIVNTGRESKQWYVPFRNTIFLSYALAYAESVTLKKGKKPFVIVTGFKCEGKEPYPDTTSEYVKMMNMLTKTAAPSLQIKIEAPLITMDKEDIILLGNKLGVDFSKTWSCYAPLKSRHCGRCLACRLRKAGFYWANLPDPTKYDDQELFK